MPIGYVRVSIDDHNLDPHGDAQRPAGREKPPGHRIGSAKAARRKF